MKRVTASQARKDWFRLLDEVTEGETVVIERRGRRVILRRETVRRARARSAAPDYSGLLDVPDLDRLDRWTWEWNGPGEELRPSVRRK
jgi:antitoxin (DNA-binding transcriptional repressor) of toxin-antitoxin stability system